MSDTKPVAGQPAYYVDFHCNLIKCEVIHAAINYCVKQGGALCIVDTVFLDSKQAVWAAMQRAQAELDRASDKMRKISKLLEDA